MWNKPITTVYVRTQRYTYLFLEKYDYFTLSFFEENDRHILNYCGSHSGRDVDKIDATGLKPFKSSLGNIYFEQAKLLIECKKLYFDDIKPSNFLDSGIKKYYSKNDYHRIYTGKIIECFVKKNQTH